MPAGATDQPSPEGGSQEERYGIVTLRRMRKDDGRSLILYSHEQDHGDSGEASAPASTGAAEPA
jgi:hypothetical protein